MIDEKLLDVLACPVCKAPVELEGETLNCSRPECGCGYPIEDGIPVALIEEADRSCPDCGTQREWSDEAETLSCPNCGTTYHAASGE